MPESATASCTNQTEPHLSAQVARLQAALAARQAELTASQAMVEQLTAERDQLRQAYEQLRLELELLKRRLFVAKAERVDTAQLELEFKDKLAALAQLEAQLAKELEPEPQPPSGPPPKGANPGPEQAHRTAQPERTGPAHRAHRGGRPPDGAAVQKRPG